ncbi:tetratricopeptide repeat protein [Pseudodesulfovibrio sp. JC047]|uniref:tetratricopeptide repeat protein n=1 Tax=Pseudodesulfovibrio sp. JC047 TaxID=2683199 RepID=UPI0013D89886|nr:tetratricopeptide repeat protein [Pseudodesulfovibrio sp. JC047]NDV19254.1 tetratricopeptide repeat protein [Pseudodesulfovibrio sp. JC047]
MRRLLVVLLLFFFVSGMGEGVSLVAAQSRPIEPKDMATDMLQALADNRMDEAESLAVKLKYKYPQSKVGNEALYVLGVVALRKRHFAEAQTLLAEYVGKGGVTTYGVRANRLLGLLDKDDNDGVPLALFLESERSLTRSQPLKALRLLKQSLAQYPDAAIAADTLNSLAYVYLVSLKDYEEAAKAYASLAQKHPDDSYTDNAVYGLGRCMELLGRTREAREYYLRLKKSHAILGTEISGYSIPALNEYARVWHRRAVLGLERLDRATSEPSSGREANFFMTGFGDRLVVENPPGSDIYRRLWRVLERDGMPVRCIEFTVNRTVGITWENRQELLSAASLGYVPVVIFQYFDEDLSPDFVKRNTQNYYTFIREKLAPLLEGIHEPYILLEAEFNRGGVGTWAGWNSVAIEAIRIIRETLPTAQVGLTVGDWGFKGRDALQKSMGEVAPHCDFLGYQFMISSIEDTWVQDPSGQLLDRVLDFAEYLSTTFQRPLLIGYMGVSSLDGWESVQAECLAALFRHRHDLMHMGVFGMVYFSYMDAPDKAGWFGPAERMFGLVDASGDRKPAWTVFRDAARELMQEETRAEEAASFVCLVSSPEMVSTIEVAYTFSRPRFWRVVFRGQTSGAMKTFQGTSRAVRVVWEGDADTENFLAERCHVDLFVLSGVGESPESRRIAGCEVESSGIVSWSRKVVFAEGRSSELLQDSPFVKRVANSYSGLRSLVFEWEASTKESTIAVSLKKAVPMLAGESFVLHFREEGVQNDLCWITLVTDQGNIPFPLTSYLFRDAGKGWKTFRVHQETLARGIAWKYKTRPAQIHVQGIEFVNMAEGRLLVDSLAFETRRAVEQLEVIPYISSPFVPLDNDAGETVSEDFKLYRRR